jgi:ABC-type multidrug transport system ATPase subunit
LNGRKVPIRRRPTVVAAPAAHAAEADRPALLAQSSQGAELPPPADVATQVAELTGASKSYGKTLALDDVSLHVKRGELLAVLGPNGAGKSTAIAIWLGLMEPDKGSASVMGGLPSNVDCRRRVGVMMQEVEINKQLRVRELITLTASYYRDPMSVEETLELTRTTDLADRVYSKLSGGQKRKVQFALAVCGRPELLFLDEPTAGLDVQSRQAMWATIQDLLVRGCSIVLTTHYLEEAEALADRVVVLAKSRVIASGSVAEMRALVSRRQILCESGCPADEVRSWPGVTEVIRDEQRLHITAINAEDVVRRLLAADSNLRNLEVRQAGLNEAFTQLTKEAA